MPKSHKWAGRVNLKGKKSKLLSCGCCEITNLKCKEEDKRIKKEILEEIACLIKNS